MRVLNAMINNILHIKIGVELIMDERSGSNWFLKYSIYIASLWVAASNTFRDRECHILGRIIWKLHWNFKEKRP